MSSVESDCDQFFLYRFSQLRFCADLNEKSSQLCNLSYYLLYNYLLNVYINELFNHDELHSTALLTGIQNAKYALKDCIPSSKLVYLFTVYKHVFVVFVQCNFLKILFLNAL